MVRTSLRAPPRLPTRLPKSYGGQEPYGGQVLLVLLLLLLPFSSVIASPAAAPGDLDTSL